jgi:hypothetical protein
VGDFFKHKVFRKPRRDNGCPCPHHTIKARIDGTCLMSTQGFFVSVTELTGLANLLSTGSRSGLQEYIVHTPGLGSQAQPRDLCWYTGMSLWQQSDLFCSSILLYPLQDQVVYHVGRTMFETEKLPAPLAAYSEYVDEVGAGRN